MTRLHPDILKMPRSELEAHAATGCERCQDGLRFQDILDLLIESQDKTLAASARLADRVSSLEATLRR